MNALRWLGLVSALFLFLCRAAGAGDFEQSLPTAAVEDRGSTARGGFEVLKPTYAILQLGTKDSETGNRLFAKIQINLSRKVVEGYLKDVPVELGAEYTLKALWDLTEDSMPFKDYSHNPELFLTFYKERRLNLRLGGRARVQRKGRGRLEELEQGLFAAEGPFRHA